MADFCDGEVREDMKQDPYWEKFCDWSKGLCLCVGCERFRNKYKLTPTMEARVKEGVTHAPIQLPQRDE
jgi:hypothetical protein